MASQSLTTLNLEASPWEVLEGLRLLCSWWQGLLRLADWEVVVEWGGTREMGEDLGRVDHRLADKQAVVRILEPGGFPVSAMDRWPYDPEVYLVHELLHLHFTACDCRESLAEEQAISALSRGLVRLRRGEEGARP
jgi:hypothetical protein